MSDCIAYKTKYSILSKAYPLVSCFDFYRDMFPSGTLERSGHPEDSKPNAIFTVIDNLDGSRARSYIMFDELAELDLLNNVKFSVISPVAYSGRRRTAANAFHLHGICIDLDYVEETNLVDLLYEIENKVLPECSYISMSGSGLHLYYLFEEPVPLYQYLYKPLNRLKEDLTNIVWNQYTSSEKNKQFQGIFQGFRMIGNFTKLDDEDATHSEYPVVAFKTGSKVTLRYLNEFVADEYKLQPDSFDEFNHLTLDEAKKKYPEWYENRILNNTPRGSWTCHRGLYDWWIKQIYRGAFDGNRYNCLVALSTYAIKCGIPYEELEKDCLELLPKLNELTTKEKNEFTEDDVYAALGFYVDNYVTYSIRAIEAHTKINIPRNKRRKRPLKRDDGTAFKAARAVQDIGDPTGEWRNKEGRPKGSGTAQSKVLEWRNDNPAGKPKECIAETGLNKNTVYKWWDAELKTETEIATDFYLNKLKL